MARPPPAGKGFGAWGWNSYCLNERRWFAVSGPYTVEIDLDKCVRVVDGLPNGERAGFKGGYVVSE